VFGRGGEEAQELVGAGIEFEEVPAVTSAIAAPAYAGIPITHRDHTSLVTFVTGHEDPEKEESAIPWRHLVHLGGTLVFLMGVERLRAITEQLLNHYADPNLPVALVRWGTTPRQESLEGTLGTIADIAEQRAFRPPAIIVMGDVVRLRSQLNWFESLPLFGQRVVVTRTREQSSRLVQELRALGADVLEIPTIQIQRVGLAADEKSLLGELDQHFDWLIFTSPNGAD
jgi:uroporphyrinogen III methyltransferase/synthase